MKALKLIPKILVSPLLLAIGIVYVIGNVLATVSSLVTNLVGSFFIFGAACGWITRANENMVWSIAICGIVILFLPAIVKGMLEIALKIYGLLIRIMTW